jgi:alkylation response protein AidB-like acyl-CoA dehydrogenase
MINASDDDVGRGWPVVDFQLTPSQLGYAARVRQVAAETLAPVAAGGVEGRVNRPLLRALGRTELLRDLFDDAGRASAVRLCLMRESLAQVSGEAETALALQGLGSYPIVLAGRAEMVRRWIPAVTSGEAVAAFALSEPQAGSDAAALSLRAEPDGDGWRLTGEKMWISNAPEADVYTVFARSTPGTRSRGITAFVVAGDSPGLTGEALDMLAPHPIGRLAFNGVRVGREGVLGDIDQGFALAMRTLDVFRPSVGACAVGLAQAALDATIEYIGKREVQGGSLAGQQAVRHAIADMATRLEASRLLVYAAAAAIDGGTDPREQSRRSAMAKLFATESAQAIIDGCVQFHGAVALRRGHPLEHLYRDVRSLRIYEGASEIQRTIIAREVIGRGSTA